MRQWFCCRQLSTPPSSSLAPRYCGFCAFSRFSAPRSLRFLPRRLASRAGVLDLGIDLTADQDEKTADVHPRQQNDNRANTAIRFIVRAEIVDVVRETQRREGPGHHGEDRARRDPLPFLLDVRR